MDMVEIGDNYRSLCSQLLDTRYIYFVGNDSNRAEDGMVMRDEYERKYGTVNDILDECTLLEMFVKLAMRCDDDVMFDPEFGDRTGEWFWNFLDNLRLTKYDDRHYDEDAVNDILDDFNNRHYGKYGGKGCAFLVKKPLNDMRVTEIWYQMLWWLNESYPEV